mmetsp:Transcript_10058/g.20238  ORF Transcript_10058/g.20238 Transcript_10058/m.20238 type:complete len:82 (+) Transcript_10058:95-340(+)
MVFKIQFSSLIMEGFFSVTKANFLSLLKVLFTFVVFNLVSVAFAHGPVLQACKGYKPVPWVPTCNSTSFAQFIFTAGNMCL